MHSAALLSVMRLNPMQSGWRVTIVLTLDFLLSSAWVLLQWLNSGQPERARHFLQITHFGPDRKYSTAPVFSHSQFHGAFGALPQTPLQRALTVAGAPLSKYNTASQGVEPARSHVEERSRAAKGGGVNQPSGCHRNRRRSLSGVRPISARPPLPERLLCRERRHM